MTHTSTPDEPTERVRTEDAVGDDKARRIFPLIVVAMWVVAGFLVANDAWSGLNTLLLVEAAVICAIVFVNFVYVFNYGYATTVVVLTITVLVVRGASPVALVLGVLLVLYGIRLAAFSLQRYRSPGYAATTASLKDTHRALPSFVKVFVWVQTISLMTFHAMTMVAVGTAEADFETASIVGVALVAIGMVTEATADLQKQRAKNAAPSEFVRTGLFARTRHPNYLGEILFQVGIAVTGLSVATQWYGKAAVVLGPLYIVALMLSMVLRGERTKRARYGDDPAYAAYVNRSGALFPSLRG